MANPSLKYLVTAQRLVAHCVENHGDGIWTIAKMCRSYFPVDPERIGLTQSVKINQERLVDEILSNYKLLDAQNEGCQAVAFVASSIDEVHFERLWKSTWRFYCQARWSLLRKIHFIISLLGLQDLARNSPRLAGALFRIAAYLPSRSSYAIDLIDQSSEDLFQIIRDDLVFSLIWSPQLISRRDKLLEYLLSRHGCGVAKMVLRHSQYAKDVPSCVAHATRILLDSEPNDSTVPIGIGLCLQIDPSFAVPIIVDWVNTGKSNQHYDQFFRWKVQQSEQRELFRALASDCIRRDAVWHRILGQIHQGLITRLEPVIEWLDETLDNRQTSRYNASLVVAYLSETRKSSPPEMIKKLIYFGHTLHEKYGSRDQRTVLSEFSLTDPKLENYEELVAIALAKDLTLPTRKIDGEKVLQTIEQLPSTYKALGGTQFDKAVTDGNLPPFAEYYTIDGESELKRLEARLKSGEIDQRAYQWKADLLTADSTRASGFRNRWETRFAKILTAGVNLPTRKLRTDANVWNEMRVLAQLVDFFNVKYEPSGIPGMGTRQPEFVLNSPDGDLILEVATIGTKPEEVREAVTVSTGGMAKKTLQNKLREQFNECRGDFSMPIVIAVQTKWSLDEYDFLNSLYGPFTVNLLINKESGELVEEGESRSFEKAFFNEANVSCISAVARLEPENPNKDELLGELYRPINSPRHPLSAKLWLRLRDAMFGPVQMELVLRMKNTPGILDDEAEMLVKYGVDDLSFFAAGLIEFPEGLPMKKVRFEELQNMAMRLALIHQTGKIVYLNTAKGMDLTPLYSQKIYTINELLKCNQKPADVSEKVWRALRDEAKTIMKRDDL